MSIVRSLLVAVGFQLNKKSVNATNTAIKGFRTRFGLAATAATYALSVVKKFFGNIASAVVDSDELARSLGISLNELTALQRGAQDFRISPEQLSGAFSTIQKDLNEFRQGFGRIPQLFRDLELSISRDSSIKEIFDSYIEAIRLVENEQERIRISSAIFGTELGTKISDLSQDFDKFKISVNEAYRSLENTPDITGVAREYEKSVNSITNSFSDLFKTIVNQVAPALKLVFDGLKVFTNLIGGYATFFSSGNSAPLESATREKEGFFSNIATGLSERFQSAGNFLVGLDPRNSNSSSINVTNSIDVNVPQGTTQEQVAFLSQEMQNLIDESIMDTFYRIQNNNPVVE